MRLLAPRPLLLVLTLLSIVGAISFIELRFKAADASDTQVQAEPPPAQQISAEPTAEQSDESTTSEWKKLGSRKVEVSALAGEAHDEYSSPSTSSSSS